jgi:predicted phage-related endonuclease
LKTRRVNKPFIHEEHDFLRANIDRQILNGERIDGTSLLELKTTTSHRLKALDYQYPRKWYFQIQHYLGITGYNQAFLFIYERDTAEFYEPISIARDEKFITENMEQLIEWWNSHIVEGKRPAPINEEDLLMLYPNSSKGKIIEATRDSFECYEELTRLRDRKSDLEKREEYLKNKLKEELGDAERLVLAGRTLVSWKSYSRQRLDSKKLREEEPEVYADYLTKTSYRRFSV